MDLVHPQTKGRSFIIVVCSRVSQLWHYWHFGLDNSLSWDIIRCFVRCLAASLTSVHWMLVTYITPSPPSYPKMSPDTARCHLGAKLPWLKISALRKLETWFKAHVCYLLVGWFNFSGLPFPHDYVIFKISLILKPIVLWVCRKSVDPKGKWLVQSYAKSQKYRQKCS